MREFLRRHLTGALIIAALLLAALATMVVAQQQSLELVGVRPFIRLEGREAGGRTFELRESAGVLSLSDVSIGMSQTPVNVLYAVGGGTTGCTNAGTDDTLISYALPANALNANYKGLEIQAWGTTAANANNKTVKLFVGGTTLVSSGALALNNKDWMASGTYIRYGAATEDALGIYWNSTPTTVGPTRTAATDDTTTSLTVKVTGACPTAANDAVGRGMVVKLLN